MCRRMCRIALGLETGALDFLFVSGGMMRSSGFTLLRKVSGVGWDTAELSGQHAHHAIL